MKNKAMRALKSLSPINYAIGIIILTIIGYSLIFFSSKTVTIFIEMIPQNQEWSSDSPPPIFQETDAISAGDSVYNSFGQKVAEVSDVNTVNYGGTKRFMKVIIKVKAKFNPRTKIYSYNETPLLVGNLMSLSLGQSAFKGKIINIYKNDTEKYKLYQFKNAVVTVLFRGIEPAHAEAMKNFEARDAKGNILAKTLDFQINPQEMDVFSEKSNGRTTGLTHGQSSIYKDVTLKLLLPGVACAKNTCYFNDVVDLKIGIPYFWIHSDTTFLTSGVISTIEYSESTTSASMR